MRLSRFLARTRALGDTTLNGVELDALEDAVGRGDDLPALLKARPTSYPSLSPRNLLTVWRTLQALRAHEQFLEDVGARRREAGLPAIPAALLSQTIARHEIAVLERADTLVPPGATAEHRRRDAIKEALLVWNACIAIAQRDGTAQIQLSSDGAGDAAAEFGSLVGTEKLSDIPPQRWLAIRRGRKTGALKLEVGLPIEALVGQVQAHAENMKAIAGGRDARGLAQILILADLGAALVGAKDEEAELRSVQSASEAYLGLLCSARPKLNLAAGVWVPSPGEPLSVAIVGRDGRVLHHQEVTPGENAIGALEAAFDGQPVDGVVLPTTSDDPEFLERLSKGLEPHVPVHRIKAAALEGALETVTEDLPRNVKFAVILARRCIRPMRTWSQVDPVSLGLADYQQDLDEARLRRALVDVQSVALAGIKPEDLSKLIATQPSAGPIAKPVVVAPRAPPPAMNPLIKGVDDLRPGMKLNGVISNITQFGAFVNIGLKEEGLIHVSELADHFVKDPNEVVKVGQSVAARVLGIDRARNRISLSLKAERGSAPLGPPDPRSPLGVPPARPPGPPTGGGGGDRRRGGHRGGGRPQSGGGGGGGGGGKPGGAPSGTAPATGGNRDRALADLEALFRKP